MMFFHLFVSGLSNGALYALVALGLITIYRATLVVNFAHGEVFMLGAFFGYMFHVSLGLPYPASLVLAIALSLLLGIVTERIAYRPLIRASVVSLVLASVGFSFLLKGFARVTWGGKGDYIPFPPIFTFRPIQFLGLLVVPQNLVILGGALFFMGILWAFFRYTKLGKMMRATAENQRAAALVGIRIERVFAVIWGVGTCLGAVAGLLMAPVTLLYPDMGGTLLIQAFASAILGGFGSMPGAVLGGFVVGLAESLVGGYLGSQFITPAPFVIIIAVLIVRPAGILGTRTVAKF
jgi:branched-chain amino acid transport system permease protein